MTQLFHTPSAGAHLNSVFFSVNIKKDCSLPKGLILLFFLLTMAPTTTTIPSFDQLPIDPKYPPQTAWGVWGEEDDLGTLNLLTEERVANVKIYIILFS